MESSTADRLSWRVLAVVWLVTTGVGLLALDARATYGARVTADEPQYLLTALSIAEDFDLNIADELADERFRDFHETRLNPQTIDLNADGQRISPHDPLLPSLLALAMGLGGWVGAKIALAAVAGLTAAVTAFVANRWLGVGRAAAVLVTIGLFTSPPLTVYATQVYPEMPAALAMVVGVAGLLGLRAANVSLVDHHGRSQLMVLAAIVALPWLSVKYIPVAMVLAVALVAPHRQRERRRQGFVLVAALGAAGALYLVIHQRIYGGWTVYAAGDHFVDGEFTVIGSQPNYVGRSRRLIGLLIDRRFGLIPWAPAYLLLVPAVAAILRRRSWPRALVLGLLGVGWAVATWIALTMHGWWWPGRQLVVVLPMAVIAIAGLLDGRPRLLVATTVASAISVGNWLWLVVEASTDRRTLIFDFFETAVPLYRTWAPLFPNHMTYDSGDQILTAAWVAAAVAGAWWGWRSAEPPTTAAPAHPAAASTTISESDLKRESGESPVNAR